MLWIVFNISLSLSLVFSFDFFHQRNIRRKDSFDKCISNRYVQINWNNRFCRIRKSYHFSDLSSFDIDVSLKSYTTKPDKNTLPLNLLLTLNDSKDVYIRSFIYNKQWDVAKSVLSSLNYSEFSIQTINKDTGNVFNRTLLFVILETCRRSNNIDRILPLIECIPTSVIKNHYENQSLNQSLSLLRNSLSDDLIPFLSDLSSKKSISLAQPILTYLVKQFGYSIFNIKALSIIIRGYGVMKNENMIDNVLAAMTENMNANIQPDVVFLNTAIDAYINCGNVEKALDLFDYATYRQDNDDLLGNKRMRYIRSWGCFLPNYIYPNVLTFNTIIKGYRNSRKSSFLIYQNLLNKMKNANINIDSITINTIIDSVVSSGDLLKAEYLLNLVSAGSENRFESADQISVDIFMNTSLICAPGVEAYTSVMKGFSQERNVDGVFRIMEMMKTRSIRFNSYTITTVINACIVSGKIGKARDLLIGRNNDFFKNITAEESTFIYGLCKLFQLDLQKDLSYRNNRYLKEALAILVEMEKKNIKPDTVTLNAFIKGLCSSTLLKIEDSLSLLKAMIAEEILPDAYTFSILFSAMGSQGLLDQALELYRDNINRMDTVATNSLLKVFADSDNPLSSIDFFNELVSKNQTTGKVELFIPDKVTYTILFMAISTFVINLESTSNVNNNINDLKNTEKVKFYKNSLESDDKELKYPSQQIQLLQNNPTIDLGRNLSLSDAYNSIQLNKYLPISSEVSRQSTYKLGSTFVVISGINVTVKNYKLNDLNSLVKSLFSQLRYDYKIDPDIVLIKAINSLFSHHLRISRRIYSNQEFLSRDTARLLFQEIIIAGFHPRDVLAILNSCGYSFKQTEEYLYDENVLKNLRASAASYRIFTKHGWNKIQSGWSTIF